MCPPASSLPHKQSCRLDRRTQITKVKAIHTAISHLKFQSARLSVENWRNTLNDPAKRQLLENELSAMLTPNITRYLPLSMQFSVKHGSISQWVSDRASEAQILCARSRETATLVGLIILSADPEPSPAPTFHLGYFLAEKDWGKGYATELITALLSAFENGPQTRIVAGVDLSNAASARVLEKTGFKLMQQQSTAQRQFFEIKISCP